jgi:hypothetical protein
LGSATSALGDTQKRTITNIDSIRRFMEKGQSLFAAGQYQRAAEVFEAGYELHPYSAFLFNAGVALEKSDRRVEAIEHFKKYLEVDPKAPDAAEVKKRIANVEQALKDQSQANQGKGDSTKSHAKPSGEVDSATKSLVIVETEPPGATLHILRRTGGESTYTLGEENPDWVEVLATESPANASLDVGQYHVRVDQLQDFNRGDTSFEVLPGHVLQVKVNLSQGQFMGHLRVVSNVSRARVFLDDEGQKKQPWGRSPFADFVAIGEHSVLVAATGFAPVTKKVTLARGEQQELRVDLQRLPVGALRVSSNVPNALVVLDGMPVGSTTKAGPPLELQKLRAGKHHLRITAEGRKPLEADVEVPRGLALPAHARLVVLPPRAAAYAQAIIGGVLLGGGIYFGLESNRLYDEIAADHARGSLASDDSRGMRGKIYSIGADVAFLGAAALSGLAVYSFLRDPLPPSRLVVYKAVEFDSPNRSPGSSAKEPVSSIALPGSAERPAAAVGLATLDETLLVQP